MFAAILRFFDEHLAGIDTGLRKESPVHVHIMRAEAWLAAAQWPVADRTTVHYLADGGRLAPESGTAGHVDYAVDYACATGRNTRYGRLQVRNVRDYYDDWSSTVAGRLRFVAPALNAPLSIAGHPIVTLNLASDQADACVFVYLEDIAPDGSVHYVTEGMLRALHRGTSEPSRTYATAWASREYTRKEARPLTPGEMVELTFAMLPTAWEFPSGHRIALSIAGADRDNFALWPYGRPGHWRIQIGGETGSRIELPVI